MKTTSTRLFTLGAVVLAALSLTACSVSVDGALREAANELNQRAPYMVDDGLQFDSAEAPGDRLIRLNYTLTEIASGDLTPEQIAEFQGELQAEATRRIRIEPDMQTLRDFDVVFEFHNKTNDGEEILFARVTPEDYK
ncbi:MAG: hypothetical protein FWG15_00115 [Propionibacteriaceae bacterium]|nr:hypothetical protein [Propionibacteriaceae bacterium]